MEDFVNTVLDRLVSIAEENGRLRLQVQSFQDQNQRQQQELLKLVQEVAALNARISDMEKPHDA
jgi:hypothetical protein